MMIERRRARVRPMGTDLALLALAAGLHAWMMPVAHGYVRYRSDSDCPYSWRTRTIAIQGFPQGLADLTVGQIRDALAGATTVWTKRDLAMAACTDLDLRLTMQSLSKKPPAAKYDQQNNVIFRSDAWCAESDGPSNCYDRSALAITSVFAKGWGQIVDADIEVNAVNFSWSDLQSNPEEFTSQDLQNVLTHEIGHLLGLDHTCYSDVTRLRPVGNDGVAIPDCGSASEAVLATTMFASAEPGDVTKRTLESDDQLAICETYPLGKPDPLICPAPDDGGGCAVASPGSAGRGGGRVLTCAAGGVVVAGFALGMALKRRGSQRRSKSSRRSRTDASPGEAGAGTSTSRSSGRYPGA
jgi:hypothetical protein